MLQTQSTTGPLHGQAHRLKRASAAVKVGQQQLRVSRLVVPLRQQTADRSCRYGHELSNLWRTEALLMKFEDALTRVGRCGSRHAEHLPAKKRRTASRCQPAWRTRQGQTGPNGGDEEAWQGRHDPAWLAGNPCSNEADGARFYLRHPRAANLCCADRRRTYLARGTKWPGLLRRRW